MIDGRRFQIDWRLRIHDVPVSQYRCSHDQSVVWCSTVKHDASCSAACCSPASRCFQIFNRISMDAKSGREMAFRLSSESPHHHLSHALQGQHDTSIPVHLPLLFGFLSSFVCGVLNFGESMTFTLLWNFARFMNWLDTDVTFQKGVVYSQVNMFHHVPLSLTCLLIWFHFSIWFRFWLHLL